MFTNYLYALLLAFDCSNSPEFFGCKVFRLGIILFFLLTHQQAVELTTGQYSIIVLTIELVKQWHYFHNNAIMHSTYDADTYRHTFSSNM